MRNVSTHLIVFILLSAPLGSAAQDTPYVFDNVSTALRRHCAVCRYRLPEYYDTALLRLMHKTGVETFHKGHIALQRRYRKSAYRYAQRTIAVLTDSIEHPLYANALFLWAKTNHLNGLFKSATRQYSQFLTINSADSVLLSDAHVSLGALYIQNRDWEKAANILEGWQRYYFRFADAKTTANLFDRIVNIFTDSVDQPQAAIHLGTKLFTKQKDTIRLIRFYYNIAQWYKRHSKEESAIVYLKNGLKLALGSRDYGMQKSLYRDLAMLEEKKGQFQTAAQYNKAYKTASDSVYHGGTSPRALFLQKEKLLQIIKGQSAPVSEQTEPYNTSFTKTGWLGVILFLLVTCSPFFIGRIRLVNQSQLRFLKGEVQRLGEANASKDQLFSVIAHDLRSAVHALQINIGKLKTALQKLLVPEAVTLAGSSEQLANSIQSLLNNLLYWSLSQAGRISYHPEPVALQPLLNGICYDLLPLAESKNITLHYTLEKDIVCTSDLNTTKIIFRNLIDNAIKYTPAGGTVTVSARQEEQLCAVTVQDTGIGMAPHIMEALLTGKGTRIQQDASGRRSTGIGLWLVKNMAGQNGGALHISSIEGVGTTMTVTLPMTP